MRCDPTRSVRLTEIRSRTRSSLARSDIASLTKAIEQESKSCVWDQLRLAISRKQRI